MRNGHRVEMGVVRTARGSDKIYVTLDLCLRMIQIPTSFM